MHVQPSSFVFGIDWALPKVLGSEDDDPVGKSWYSRLPVTSNTNDHKQAISVALVGGMRASSRPVGCEFCVETIETTPSLCPDKLDICCRLLEEGIASDSITMWNGASLSWVTDVGVFSRCAWFEQFSAGTYVCAEPKGLFDRAGRDMKRRTVCSWDNASARGQGHSPLLTQKQKNWSITNNGLARHILHVVGNCAVLNT